MLRNAGRVEEAEQVTRQAIELQQELVAEFPNVLQHQLILSNHRNTLCLVLKQMGRLDEAEQVLRQIAEFRKNLVAAFPDVPRYQENMSNIHNELTDVLSKLDRWQEAKQESRQAIELMEKLVADFSDVPNYQHRLAHYHSRLGKVLSTAGRWQEVEQEHRQAAELSEQLVADFPDVPKYWADVAHIWYWQALAQLGAGQMEEYRGTCANMLQRFGRTEDPSIANLVAWTCILVQESVEDLGQVVQLAEKAVEANDTIARLNTLGAVLYRAGRFDEAIQKLSGSTAYTSTWFFTAMAHHRLGHFDESRKWLNQAVERTEETQDTTAWSQRLILQLLRREAELLMGRSEQTRLDGEEVVPVENK